MAYVWEGKMKRQIKFLKENYLLAIGFSLMFLSSLTGVIDMAMEKKDLFRYLIILCPFVIAFFLLILVGIFKIFKKKRWGALGLALTIGISLTAIFETVIESHNLYFHTAIITVPFLVTAFLFIISDKEGESRIKLLILIFLFSLQLEGSLITVIKTVILIKREMGNITLTKNVSFALSKYMFYMFIYMTGWILIFKSFYEYFKSGGEKGNRK